MARTKVVPKLLYENRNTSDVFSRLIIMGVLRVLNLKLVYQQVWEDNNEGIQNVTVPFFFDFSGGAGTSEKFILDNYLNWTDDECTSMGLKKMNGDFKCIPYGVISLESTTIDAGNISNRFVMGKYLKKINNEMKSYVACLYSIPLTMSFNVNIACDTVNTMWKIEQAYREYFYKNKTFHVNYRGTVVPCRIGFPESLTKTATTNYTMGALSVDGADVKLTFSLLCETYLPVFDPYTEMAADNNIKGFHTKYTLLDDLNNVKYEDGEIHAITSLNNSIIVTGLDTLLQWSFDYNRSDLLLVDILYKLNGSDEYELIELNVDNHNCYHLELDDTFVENPVLIDVIILNNADCVVVDLPMIKFFADPETNIVSCDTCAIINKGFILTEKTSLDAIISYYKNNRLIEHDIKINLLNGSIDPENPVTMKDIIYPGEVKPTKMQFFVRDHNNPEIIAAFQDENEWIDVF